MDTTSAEPSTPSASRPRWSAPTSSSTASGRTWRRTRWSACSASSGATPVHGARTAMAISDIRCCIPSTLRPRPALPAGRGGPRPQRPALRDVLCSEGAIWQGGKLEEFGPAMRTAQEEGERRRRSARRSPAGPGCRPGAGHHLRPASAIPTRSTRCGEHLRDARVELIAQGTTGRMLCIQGGLYTTRNSRPRRGRARWTSRITMTWPASAQPHRIPREAAVF